ncbi:MAG: AEC family transporter [Verrucomicrobiota bacterium JB023]|nr:AEC family transporter [Verrucomicrobiota bacterium JB023]
MISFETVLAAVLPVYLLCGLGAVLRRSEVLPAAMEGGLLKVSIHILYPCLILDKVLGNDLILKPAVVGWGIGVGLLCAVLGYGVSWMIGSLLGMKAGTGRRSFTLAGGVQNYGYTAIPVLAALFVEAGGSDRVLGLLFIHSLGIEIALWVVGILILTGSIADSRKFLLNGPIVAVVAGLVVSYTGVWQWLEPDGPLLGAVIRQVMNWLGQCAFPVALLLIGGMLMDLAGKEKLDLKVAAGGVIVRNVAMAFVILALAKYLPVIEELKQVLVVQAAMPAAMTPILMTRLYGGRPQVAVQVVLATSIFSLVTMPLIVAFGVKWVL